MPELWLRGLDAERGLDSDPKEDEAIRGLDSGDNALSVDNDQASSNDPTTFTGEGGW